MTPGPLVIGIGNPDRGDDAAGRIAARLLCQRLDAGGRVEVMEHDGEVSGLLDLLAGAEAVYLIDAAWSGGTPGTVHRFDARDGPLPQSMRALSTHGFGPAEALELARAMGRLPDTCVVYAIEGAAFDAGGVVSGAVTLAIQRVVGSLAGSLAGEPPDQ